jgi:hypothetical protein
LTPAGKSPTNCDHCEWNGLTGIYSGILKLRNQKPKYQITHPSGKVAEKDNVELKVHYNVQPWVGLLTWDQGQNIGLWKKLAGGVSEKFQLPALKTKKKDAKKSA